MYSIILFFIFGIILGMKIFYKNNEHGPNSNKIMKIIFYDSNSKKYYKFTPEVCIAPLI